METAIISNRFLYPNSSRNYLTILPSSSSKTLLNLSPEEVIPLYKEYGALLFRGFQVDLKIFSDFSSQFVEHNCVSPARKRKLLKKACGIQTVNLGYAAFPLHTELSQDCLKPDICWFYCSHPPQQGGETLICDGCQIVKNLCAETRSLLSEKMLLHSTRMPLKFFNRKVKYRYGNWRNALKNPRIAQDYSLNASNFFERLFPLRKKPVSQHSLAPCLHRPLFSQELAFGNFLLFSRLRHNNRHYPTFEDGSFVPDEIVDEIKEVSDALTTTINWEEGDLLMLDNTRFMHGRNQINPEHPRKIFTRFSTVNFS